MLKCLLEIKRKEKTWSGEAAPSSFFFLIHVGCPGQLTHTTTIPHDPLDILQAQEQVRHRGGDRRAHRGSNPGGRAEQVHDGPQQLNPQVLGTHKGSNQGTQGKACQGHWATSPVCGGSPFLIRCEVVVLLLATFSNITEDKNTNS